MLMSRESRYFHIMTLCNCIDRHTYMYIGLSMPIACTSSNKCGCNAIHLQISKFITATNLILYLLSRSTAFLQVPSRATRHTLAGRSGFRFSACSSKRICGEGDWSSGSYWPWLSIRWSDGCGLSLSGCGLWMCRFVLCSRRCGWPWSYRRWRSFSTRGRQIQCWMRSGREAWQRIRLSITQQVSCALSL